jgi:predicted dehydrogenase
MNIGILGLAHPHVNAYSDQWREHPEMDVQIEAVWDHDAARAKQMGDKFGIGVDASPEDLLRRPDISAVVIASETSLHAELVEKAAANGKAIVVQKPLALTISEADRIVAAVERRKIPFSIAWQMRVDPQNIKMKELVANGALGRIFMVRRRHGLPTQLWKGFDSSWHVNPKYNRDIWADDAAHPADFIYWLLGMPMSVTAEITSLLNPKIPNDNGIAIFRFATGTIAEISCSFTCVAGENTTEIVGEKGVIIQNFGDVPSANVPRSKDGIGLKWFLQEQGNWTPSDIPEVPDHGARIRGLAGPLAEFLHGRRPPIATAVEGREVLRMMLATYESSEKGIRVEL